MKMTKPGYTHIIVQKDLHRRLKEEAKRKGLSISKLIKLLLEHVLIPVLILLESERN